MILSSRRRIRLAGAAVAFATLALAHGPSLAGTTVNTGYFGGVAIMGYDPVAYFTDGKAAKGSDKLSYEWLGTSGYSTSKKPQEMFMSEPVKYAPQYGRYCAGTMVGSGTTTVNIDP